MKDSKIAVIDLGTNTFHLLIVDVQEFKLNFSHLYKERQYVFLGENGVETISDKAIERGFDVLVSFKKIIDTFGVDSIYAFGTEALRKASNSESFVKKVKEEIGFEIQVISGDKEAQLISKGISWLDPLKGYNLIMDIGGGSVEFIIVVDGKVTWFKSYAIGISVLFNLFHKIDPMPTLSIKAMYQHLEKELATLFDELDKYHYNLIGASGTFDVIQMKRKGIHLNPIDWAMFGNLLNKSQEATLEERLAFSQLPKQRAKYIVVALLLINFVKNKINIDSSFASPFAMKEGVIHANLD